MSPAFIDNTLDTGGPAKGGTARIRPGRIAFDIDGVVADTMSLFIDIARTEYRIDWIQYEDITSYKLEDAVGIEESIISAIIRKLLDGDYHTPLRPISGAPEVLSRLARARTPVLFVTARPYLGPIETWLAETVPLDAAFMEVVATGSFDAKTEVLLERGITHFVEDRLETCYGLEAAGITPILFKQPWNRRRHNFTEVGSWRELETLIEFE